MRFHDSYAIRLLALAGASLPLIAQPVCEHDDAPLFPDIRFEISRDLSLDSNVVVADFNNDGQPDLAWLAGPVFGVLQQDFFLSRSVNVALGCPCGRFTEVAVIDTAVTTELVAGDFNNDGLIDLVTNTDGLSLFTGLGDGQFNAPVSIDPAHTYKRIGAFDLDGDGDTDLLTDRGCYRADPQGLAQTQAPFTSLTVNVPFEFADLDGDGSTDAVCERGAFRFDSELNIIAFDEAYPVLARANLSIADFDRDGQPEVAAAGHPDNSFRLTIYEIEIDPDDAIRFVATEWGDKPDLSAFFRNGVTAADLDSDGWPDAIGQYTLFRPVNPTSVLGRSGGSRQFEVSGSLYGGPQIAFIDVNHDGTPDLVKPGRVQLARSDSGLLPTFLPRYTSTNSSGTHLLAGDFDQDGEPDYFCASNGRYGFGFGAQPSPTFPLGLPIYQFVNDPDESGCFFQIAADINGDNVRDIVGGDYSGRIVSYINNADRTVTRQALAFPDAATDLAAIDVADLDGDGDLDAVAIINDDEDLVQQSELVVAWNSDGTLTAGDRIPVPNELNSLRLLLTDTDGDGDVDAVVTDRREGSPNGVFLLEQTAPGTFENPTRIDLGKPSYWILEANIDDDPQTEVLISLTGEYSDGFADLVAIDRDAGGGLLWSAPRQLLSVSSPRINEFLAEDMNEDGRTDIVVCTGSTTTVNEAITVFLGQPDGSFTYDSDSFSPSSAGGGIASLLLVDLNRDGLRDVFYLHQTGYYETQGPSSYPPCRSDMNADGFTDFGDIQAFIAYFLEQHPAADLNRDTIIDLGDVGEFVTRFVDGC